MMRSKISFWVTSLQLYSLGLFLSQGPNQIQIIVLLLYDLYDYNFVAGQYRPNQGLSELQDLFWKSLEC